MSPARPAAVLTLGVAAALVSAAAPLQAQSPFTSPSRVSSYSLTFLDFRQFLDASTAYQFTHNVSTNGVPVSVPGATISVKSLYSGFFSGSTGNATTSHSLQSANLFSAPWSTTGGPGTITYGYDTPVAPTFAESWIIPGINNGRYTLDFVGGGSGWAAGGISNVMYKLIVTINGDWSQLGTGTGQVEWLGYTGTGYTVDKLFTYANGVTTLELSNPNWDYNSPNASFRLHGATVVPEPGSVALVATGLLGLGVMARARRRHQA